LNNNSDNCGVKVQAKGAAIFGLACSIFLNETKITFNS